MKNLAQLIKDLNENEELRTKFEAAMDTYEGEEKNPDTMKVEIAKEFGYEPDENEIAKLKAGEQELSLEDLDSVAGGWCMKNNDCYSVYRNVSWKTVKEGIGIASGVVAVGGLVITLEAMSAGTITPALVGVATMAAGTAGVGACSPCND